MTKEGMSEKEVRHKLSVLKQPQDKLLYLKKIIDRKGKLLRPETREIVKKLLSESYIKSGEWEEKHGPANAGTAELYRKAGTKEGYIKAAKIFEKQSRFEDAARCYSALGTKEGYEKVGDIYMKMAKEDNRTEIKGNCFEYAYIMYNRAGMKKKAQSIYKSLNQKYGRTTTTLEKIVTSLMLFSGLGLLWSFFSKSNVGTITQQLAPPMPNYIPLILFFFVISGSFYFLIKAFRKKKKYSIPLSFAR